MLFNSYSFIFLFLPVVLFGFFGLAKFNRGLAATWLVAASLLFYGYWNTRYIWLLLGSISVNYCFGYLIAKVRSRQKIKWQKFLLVLAITANLLLLGYHKYAGFFLSTANTLLEANWTMYNVVLPLGISFFTFTQIAFLVDTHQGKVKEYNFIHYMLFVTYFPHLIAGPILHHKDIMPQLARPATYRFSIENVTRGFTIFIIGLFKKTVLADGVAAYVTPIFDMASKGGVLDVMTAWKGALAFTLQIYFDFSAYSDMAIGISLMFGVWLPINFNSPYKSRNIIEFWRRWHITLSRFLRDYLYIPLGGNRRGESRRYINLLITMLLGGLWHGAAWTFVVWGGLHGVFLMVNHAWRSVLARMNHGLQKPPVAGMRILSLMLTFLCVTVAWVFFRAENIETANTLVKSMFGLQGAVWPTNRGFLPFIKDNCWIFITFAIALLLPNTQQFMEYKDAFQHAENAVRIKLNWKPTVRMALILGIMFVLALARITMIGQSPFLYWNF